jgi:hypothetical protein
MGLPPGRAACTMSRQNERTCRVKTNGFVKELMSKVAVPKRRAVLVSNFRNIIPKPEDFEA